MHQPIKKPIKVRRGEGGGERLGGPLWDPAWGTGNPSSWCRSTTTSSTRRVTRATIKALPAPLHRPRPYGSLGLLPLSPAYCHPERRVWRDGQGDPSLRSG